MKGHILSKHCTAEPLLLDSNSHNQLIRQTFRQADAVAVLFRRPPLPPPPPLLLLLLLLLVLILLLLRSNDTLIS